MQKCNKIKFCLSKMEDNIVKVKIYLVDSPAVDELNVKTLTSVPMLLRTLLPFAEHSFSNLGAEEVLGHSVLGKFPSRRKSPGIPVSASEKDATLHFANIGDL